MEGSQKSSSSGSPAAEPIAVAPPTPPIEVLAAAVAFSALKGKFPEAVKAAQAGAAHAASQTPPAKGGSPSGSPSGATPQEAGAAISVGGGPHMVISEGAAEILRHWATRGEPALASFMEEKAKAPKSLNPKDDPGGECRDEILDVWRLLSVS